MEGDAEIKPELGNRRLGAGAWVAAQPFGKQPQKHFAGGILLRLCAALFVFLLVRSVAGTSELRGVAAWRDLEYGRAGEVPLRLDLYVPENPDGALPLVLWIHGGGWRSGSKVHCPALFLTRRGYAVASVDYRLVPDAVFPAQIQDCKAAVRWLRAHAQEYRLDPKRFGVWGASAGGHLAALLGTAGDVPQFDAPIGDMGQSSRVQAVCDFFGPVDFTPLLHLPPDHPRAAAHSAVSQLLGGPLREREGLVRLASPVTHVSPDDPPFLIVHGSNDEGVPISQSRSLFEALQKAGVPCSLHIVEGAGHGMGGMRDSAELEAKVAAFFDQHLKTVP